MLQPVENRPSQSGFSHILIPFAVLVLAVIGAVGFRMQASTSLTTAALNSNATAAVAKTSKVAYEPPEQCNTTPKYKMAEAKNIPTIKQLVKSQTKLIKAIENDKSVKVQNKLWTDRDTIKAKAEAAGILTTNDATYASLLKKVDDSTAAYGKRAGINGNHQGDLFNQQESYLSWLCNASSPDYAIYVVESAKPLHEQRALVKNDAGTLTPLQRTAQQNVTKLKKYVASHKKKSSTKKPAPSNNNVTSGGDSLGG